MTDRSHYAVFDVARDLGLTRMRARAVAKAQRRSGVKEGVYRALNNRLFLCEVSFYPETKWWLSPAHKTPDGEVRRTEKIRRPLDPKLYGRLTRVWVPC